MASAAQGRNYLTVVETSDAMLHCGPCKSEWCEHVEQIIRTHGDAEQFWQNRQNQEPDTGSIEWHLGLPIIPTRKLWADVVVSKNADGPYTLSLKRKHEDPMMYTSQTIGITGPGEGRAVWRSMVLDHWKMECEVQSPRCESKGHSFKAQVAWTAALQLDSSSIDYHCNAWTAWYNKLCYYCYQVKHKLITVGADDDLIPDDPPGKKWANRYA